MKLKNKPNWVQDLMDKHAGDILNYINHLRISQYEKSILEIKSKELLLDVAKDVMHDTKDSCVKIFANTLGVKQ